VAGNYKVSKKTKSSGKSDGRGFHFNINDTIFFDWNNI
jgi:hypothetical protein